MAKRMLPPIEGAELLNDQERIALQAEAKKKVLEDRKAKAKKELLARAIDEERMALEPEEDLVDCTIDLPGFADRVVIDGVVYFHGATYKFPLKQYRSVTEIIGRAWGHEHEVGGANRDAYRRPRNVALRPGAEGMSNSQLMRV